MYEDVTAAGSPTLEMPIQRGIAMTALGTRSKRIKKQILSQFIQENYTFENNFLVPSQTVWLVILGAICVSEYGVAFDFKKKMPLL